ncbi:MAG: pancreas/duodenum homeobox protein 1 [Desulfobacterales bacterium]|nr:pancreas/duodenum homeobox protein 1 [Desulfobacterales bacterium]
MRNDQYAILFPQEICRKIFPPKRTIDFFEALLGDADEGSYDIELQYAGASGKQINFDLLLHERPGHCLACNLTLGLPQVFSRHPIINIAGIVDEIDQILGEKAITGEWNLGYTQQRSNAMHAIPLAIELEEPGT